MAVYGQITYAPPTPAPTNPIPTMGETMLIRRLPRQGYSSKL
jgi:hypothetical protein